MVHEIYVLFVNHDAIATDCETGLEPAINQNHQGLISQMLMSSSLKSH